MAATETLSGSPGGSTRTTSAHPGWARAYCGPAHGHAWEFDTEDGPPPWVDLGAGEDRTCYRLLLHPVTRRPARDHWGNYLYMPLR